MSDKILDKLPSPILVKNFSDAVRWQYVVTGPIVFFTLNDLGPADWPGLSHIVAGWPEATAYRMLFSFAMITSAMFIYQFFRQPHQTEVTKIEKKLNEWDQMYAEARKLRGTRTGDDVFTVDDMDFVDEGKVKNIKELIPVASTLKKYDQGRTSVIDTSLPAILGFIALVQTIPPAFHSGITSSVKAFSWTIG